MNEHKRKMIAPIIVSVFVIIYFVIYFGIIISKIDVSWLKAVLFFIPLILSLIMIYVCIQRIKEIRSGEEDDLSKY